MKFSKKAGVILAGAALVGTSFAGLPVNAMNIVKAQPAVEATTQAETSTANVGSYLISGLKSVAQIEVGKNLEIIKPTFKKIVGNSQEELTNEKVEVVLVDPYNNRVNVEQNATEVKLTERGTYLLYYVLKDESDNELARSETVEINVVGSNYEFEFPANQYFIETNTANNTETRINAFLPEETSADYEFTLPIPNVINSKTGEGAEKIVSIDVTLDDKKPIFTFKDGILTVHDVSYENLIKERNVYGFDENGKKQSNTIKTFTITPKNDDKNHIYKFKYYYSDGAESSSVESIYDVKIADKDTFNPARTLSATLEGTGAPTSAVLGKKVTIPTPKVTNKTNSSEVEFRTTMEVVYVNKDGSESDKKDISSTFEFTPEKEGTYRVYYQVEDAFNNKSIKRAYLIRNVSDNEAPTVKFSENYEIDETTKNLKGNEPADGSYILPTKVAQSTQPIVVENYNNSGKSKSFVAAIEIPAIYAKDNAVEYKDLTLTRTVRLKTGYFTDEDGKSTNRSFNVKTEWLKQNPEKTEADFKNYNKVTIYLEKPTDYTIEFTASDGQNTRNSSYDVTVVGSNEDKELPTIPYLNVDLTYAKDSEIKFARPTATDNFDTRFNIETKYVFADKLELTPGEELKSGEINYNKLVGALNAAGASGNLSTKTTINTRGAKEDSANYYISTKGESKMLYIVTYVMDYANRVKPEDKRMARVLVTKVKPETSIDDNKAVVFDRIDTTHSPTQPADNKISYYNITDGAFTKAYQHNEVQLPALQFKDDKDENFNVSVYVSYLNDGVLTDKIRTGAYMVSTKPIDGDATYKWERVVKGGKFVPSKAGTYVVTYSAHDASGYYETVTFPIKVTLTEKPIIIPQSYNSTMELGETQRFSRPIITVNGKYVKDAENVEIVMVQYGDDRKDGVNITSDGFYPADSRFTPTIPGEYHFKYIYKYIADGEDENDALVGESEIIKITVQDTTKPVVSDVVISKYKELEFAEDSTTDYKPIEVPNITATDNACNTQDLKYEFSVTKDNKEIETSDNVGRGGNLSFTPGKTKDGDRLSYADGTYTITYKVTDIYNNVTTKTYTIGVGDIEKPKIDVSTISKANQPSGDIKLSKNGEYQLEIDIRQIKATDNSGKFHADNAVSSDDSSFGKVTFKLTGPNGTVKEDSLSDGVYKFNLTTAGKYTITYSVKDLAGNDSEPVTYTFNLVKNEAKTSTATIVWSVIAAVVALLGLGVALYFLLRDKKNKKGKKQDKEKSNDKQDDDKIVV